ncbi:hypothetical protein [Amycolatopsis suaedae]|uniref:Uncharacterized protein n=1 Tax=Amycolatopsis suaedae TaxID=2510978 RepID=A0A4Q7JBB0_9PSEU|nr:hypothetical protein [Amycolatopsis suaedae]RZQ64567.1 hypothetical protein EWH70_06560 [Amycolatopsis suaedae]
MDTSHQTGSGELRAFVLARIADDEQRFRNGELPALDEAERRGRIRVMRSSSGAGLLLVAGPVQVPEERIPVPFPEKAGLIREEAESFDDIALLKLVASVYAAHPDWQREWQP